jgi:glutamate dehydrogenase
MTQRSRIEASLRGIKLNTDAIDNSAGVNTSDLEVNIKIALSAPMRAGELTRERRNALLAEMTDEVAGLVLRNNSLQALALSLAERRGAEDLGFQQRLMQTLEMRGELVRAVEFLPDDMELSERRRLGGTLSRPELAVLMAYAKLALKDELLASAVPDDPYLGRELGRYFPRPVCDRFPDAVSSHRLRREIIVTQLANSMINRGGPSLVVRIADQTGASSIGIAAAFAAARDSFDMPALNGAIDALDPKVSGSLQLEFYAAVQDLLLDRIVWFLRNVDLSQGLARVVQHYRAGIEALHVALEQVLPPEAAAARDDRIAALTEAGVSDDLARRMAELPMLAAAPDVILVAERTGKPVAEVAATYFAAGAFFRLDRILDAARGIQVSDYFDRLALDRALDSIGVAERRLAAQMVANGRAGAEAVEAWVRARQSNVDRIRTTVEEIAGSGLTLSKLTVAASLLGDLVRD